MPCTILGHREIMVNTHSIRSMEFKVYSPWGHKESDTTVQLTLFFIYDDMHT